MTRGQLKLPVAEGASTVDDLPEVTERYLAHAIAPAVALADADTVELEINGSTMQKGRRFSFTAHERLETSIGFRWAARLRYGLLVLTGVDQLRSGQASLNFRLFGVVPFLRASGSDVVRAARGSLAIESMAALVGPSRPSGSLLLFLANFVAIVLAVDELLGEDHPDLRVTRVSVTEDQVTVRLTGSSEPPPLAPLRDSLGSSLGRPVSISIALTPVIVTELGPEGEPTQQAPTLTEQDVDPSPGRMG